ncbi:MULTISPECIES: hypothetical protein [Flammeovirga]|uniref:Lipoprotein n=1 Tax=Flammeovirga agarivorans TaxID=2726742 RepID=A0A7X8XV09_9BACT|nr:MULTISPECIES: hypothetical protein [Flammeovirga]NLR90858.1 hypothetical protein [Flammeovirga agarivorans]
MKKLILLLSTLLTIACQPYKDVIIDPLRPKFVTYDQTRMYFQNIRASYYDIIKAEKQHPDVTIYKYDKSVSDTTKAIIQLHLLYNPTQDNVFVMLSPNPYFEGYMHYTVKWTNTETGLWDEIRYKQGGMQEQFRFATEIYNMLNQDDIAFEIRFGDKTVPFLTTMDERNAFRITMIDFYRLVGLL